MKKQVIFRGCATALITPFSDGRIDYQSLEAIIEGQIERGISALVIGGTTGEAATLSDFERYSIFEFCREKAAGRAKLIFGTGTNDTRAALRHTRRASEIGCDGVLVVTPYYNKGTEDGIYEHYKAISDETDLPVLLYNVPSRTGVNLSRATLDRLAALPGIVGIKEAADSADRIVSLCEYGEDLAVYTGSDSQIYTNLALGGAGVISVVSNPYPGYFSELCRLFDAGDRQSSLKMQIAALPLIRALFLETNPAPVKYLMAKLGLCKNELRLPLAPANNATRAAIDELVGCEESSFWSPKGPKDV